MPIKKTTYQSVLNDIIYLVESTKNQIAIQANSSLTVMFWHISKRIQNERAEYRKQILVTLSRELFNQFEVLIEARERLERKKLME